MTLLQASDFNNLISGNIDVFTSFNWSFKFILKSNQNLLKINYLLYNININITICHLVTAPDGMVTTNGYEAVDSPPLNYRNL